MLVNMGRGTTYQRDEWITISKRNHQIPNEQDFIQPMDYVHYNPAKHGLSKKWRIGLIPGFSVMSNGWRRY